MEKNMMMMVNSNLKVNIKWKKNGKGKEYDRDDNLIFEGEYLNGKRWNGKGKEYD